MRIGCDLVHIKRIESSLAREAFVEKVFHPVEIAYCRARAQSSASFAARFAAKEAFVKALGVGLYGDGSSPRDVWIENDARGKPCLELDGPLRAALQAQGITHWDVSLTHHGEYAMAVVVLSEHR